MILRSKTTSHITIMKIKKLLPAIIVLLAAVTLLSGCADATNVEACTTAGHTYGFWGGLWHGFIVVFDFIGSLIWDDVAVYAQNNNGGWYDFGFMLGAGLFGGGLKLSIRIKRTRSQIIHQVTF